MRERATSHNVVVDHRRHHGLDALHIYDVAQRAIEDTTKLLNEVAQQTARLKDQPE